jgi:DNA segregation ATPase FtsK/SpoIIIE, S-DNA-T family
VTPRVREELIGIGALMVGVFLGLTLLPTQVTGSWGRGLGLGLWECFGVGAVLLPVLGIAWALAAFQRLGPLSDLRAATLGAGLVILVPYGIGVATGVRIPALAADYTLWTTSQRLAGLFPGFLAGGVQRVIGTAGGALIGLFALSALGIVTLGWHPLVGLRAREKDSGTGEGDRPVSKRKRAITAAAAVVEDPDDEVPYPPPVPPSTKSRRSSVVSSKPAPTPDGVLIPPLDLLNAPSPEEVDAGAAQIDRMGVKLIETLQTFRVEGTIAGRTVGPVVTQYEVAPGPGVKVGRIAALADDLALAMRAQSLRIVAPIPGKAAVGIEVPNPTPRMVVIRELLDTPEFRRANRSLPVALGRNLEGEAVVDDLAKMPHLLIAGATGSGKSVCINTIITSLIYSHPPEALRLLMIDPKMVELSMYASLPHLGHPVVTNNHKAATVLKWAVGEMDRRYRLLHANHARNVGDFNKKVRDGKPLVQADGMADGRRGTGDAADSAPVPRSPSPYASGILPYVVLIVDELADLMLTVQGEIETPLAILAQKARAIGIHLILATQRPSVNVLTGLIKANFPCRIAFRVSAKVDSRTILDQNGAETMLGNGDMLFLPPGKSEPVRIQGAFISTEETERLMDWYRARAPQAAVAEQGKREIEQQIAALEEAEAREHGEGTGEAGTPGDRDSLFRQAAEVCIQNQLGSTSLLQRRMSIGYGRAARIIDQLERAGVLGPANGSKPRDVLVGLEELDDV